MDAALLDRLTMIARELLTPSHSSGADGWLWEHSERVMRLARQLTHAPEIATRTPDRTALAAAALLHNVGWVQPVENGQITPWQILQRPTNDVQREVAAGILEEHLRDVLPPETLACAADAIRQCSDRYTELTEAMVLADAESLADTGILYVLRQFRLYQAEGRSLDQLVQNWQRQKEYRYWEARINDGLRFECSRDIARHRLQAVEPLMQALAASLENSDVAALLGATSAP